MAHAAAIGKNEFVFALKEVRKMRMMLVPNVVPIVLDGGVKIEGPNREVFFFVVVLPVGLTIHELRLHLTGFRRRFLAILRIHWKDASSFGSMLMYRIEETISNSILKVRSWY
jgi:hypothetical protein